MASELDTIVSVTITKATATVSQASFDTVLIVTEADDASPPFAGRTKSYASLAEMAADGFTSGNFAYDAAVRFFQQNPNPGSVKVGLKYITTTPDADWTAAMVAIRAADPNFYGVVIKSVTIADQEEVADWAETENVIFFARTADANVIATGDTTSIAYYVNNASYDRTAVYYTGTITNYPDIAALAEASPYTPGSQTWAYKTLTGVTADTLTSAQFGYAIGKECNVYQEIAGVKITRWGTVGSGEYIDVTRGLDWTTARIQEEVYSLEVNNRKIPFTDEGIRLVANAVRGVLLTGADNGLFVRDSIVVTAPLRSETTSTDRGNRVLNTVTFSADLAGAIHTTTVTGKVVV